MSKEKSYNSFEGLSAVLAKNFDFFDFLTQISEAEDSDTEIQNIINIRGKSQSYFLSNRCVEFKDSLKK